MLLANALKKCAIIATNTDSESNLMIPIGLKTIKPSLDLLYPGIDSKIILQDKMDSVSSHPTALCHKYPLPILMEPNVRKPIRMKMQHIELLELIQRPNSYSGVKCSADEEVWFSSYRHEASHLFEMTPEVVYLLF